MNSALGKGWEDQEKEMYVFNVYNLMTNKHLLSNFNAQSNREVAKNIKKA